MILQTGLLWSTSRLPLRTFQDFPAFCSFLLQFFTSDNKNVCLLSLMLRESSTLFRMAVATGMHIRGR